MQISLTKSVVRDYAHSLRKALGDGSAVSMSEAYEALAKMFKFRNWDELSGHVAQVETAAGLRLSPDSLAVGTRIHLEQPFVLVCEMSAPEDCPSPSCGFLLVNQQLLDALLSARDCLLLNSFKHVVVGEQALQPTLDFFPRESVDGYAHRLQDEDFVVEVNGFRLRAKPKHADFLCRGAWVDFTALRNALADRTSGKVIQGYGWLNPELLVANDSDVSAQTLTYKREELLEALQEFPDDPDSVEYGTPALELERRLAL